MVGEAAGGAPVPDMPADVVGLVAAALVAELWRREPPDMWTRGRRGGAGGAGLREALARLTEDADRLADEAPAAERPGVRLLGETARAVHAVLQAHGAASAAAAAPTPDPGAGGTLASPARLRLARMERWLATRAAADPSAEASVNLCLWVLEHLETDA